MADELRRTVRVVVDGRVQGVGYREFCRRAALARGVSGWVRNRSDGAVEALLAGAAADVEGTLADMRRGPRFAEVTGLRIEELSAGDDAPPAGFAVRASDWG